MPASLIVLFSVVGTIGFIGMCYNLYLAMKTRQFLELSYQAYNNVAEAMNTNSQYLEAIHQQNSMAMQMMDEEGEDEPRPIGLKG